MVNINVIGRLGADAELIDGKNGKFVSFRMAHDEKRGKDKITTWFRVTFNGERAVRILEYLTKGKLVQVFGAETVGLYQSKDGNTQISRDINANNIEFISTGSGSTTSETSVEEKPAVTTGSFKKESAVETSVGANDPADDLPF